MLALAESREEVIRTLQKDVYFKSGIWNWDQVQIHAVSESVKGVPNRAALINVVRICG